MIDGSLPGNVFLQWFQSSNDLGACLLPTSQLLANHCTAVIFGQDNVRIGELPVRQIAIYGPPRAHFSKIVSN